MAELRHYIDPGELSREIIVQTASADTVNDYGEPTSAWYNLHTLWAKIEWKGGEEKMDSEQTTNYERVEFTIRYKGDITPKIEWKGGEEKMDSEQTTNYERVDFTIRYKGDITTKMRVSYDGDFYDIESVAQVGGRKRFELLRTRKYDSNQ